MRHRHNREGFWHSSYNLFLPMPIALPLPWHGKEQFIAELVKLEADSGTEDIKYKGFSTCRLCGKVNGISTKVAMGWEWPSGYKHYIEVHNVRPSLAFQEMVLNKELGE